MSSPNKARSTRIIFIVIAAIIPLCLFPFIILSSGGRGNSAIFPILFFCLPVILLVGGGAVWFGIRKYSHSRLGKPDILIAKDELQVGESFSVQFAHTFANDITLEELKIQLVYRETATYQQGTNTRTVVYEDVVEEYELPAGNYRAGHMVADNYTMRIPPDGMHTLQVRRNQIQWFVRVKAGIPKLPDYVETFELTVIPELAQEEEF
ncbi:MAG TPA: hypothetical protein EYH05_10695 [Anaerolineae bacterium]|nr:hypothetical protein [Anaerolineae bacterium]